MEKFLMDLVNAGIAVFRSSEEGLKKAIADMESLYNEVKDKGALEQSEQANQLRDLLSKTIKDASELIEKADSSYKDIMGKLQANFEGVYTQVEAMLPEPVKQSAQSALDELKKLLEKYKIIKTES
ncbi:MAG: hypothetical protein H7A23_04470 [Leptospiraceae bacterium]|nr:hypothetical protein [Leptospiraceae bacterium]MCP5493788.1 hypothetical protein [Leptospiraceae bacterium]